MTLAIETKGLTRRFGEVVAVDGLDLHVETGTFYGFLGPNGAGKSTTIKMLTGLLAPTSGAMRILGQDMADAGGAREMQRRIGVVPEDLALFDNLTAREYLTFVGRMYLLPLETVRDRCRELLAMMDLEHEEKKLTLEYSHGMKKKLALAAALIPNPDLLFLDEPFEGVDAVSSRVLRDVLKRCVQRGVDRVSDVARAGDRGEALHRRRHHRQGQTGLSGHDGRDPPERLAGGEVPRSRRTGPGRAPDAQLAGGLK